MSIVSQSFVKKSENGQRQAKTAWPWKCNDNRFDTAKTYSVDIIINISENYGISDQVGSVEVQRLPLDEGNLSGASGPLRHDL
jgi:hypothetical protein